MPNTSAPIQGDDGGEEETPRPLTDHCPLSTAPMCQGYLFPTTVLISNLPDPADGPAT